MLHNTLYVIVIGAVCAEVAIMGAYEYHQYFGNARLRTPIAQQEEARSAEPKPASPELDEPEEAVAPGPFDSAVIFAVSSEYQSEVYPEI